MTSSKARRVLVLGGTGFVGAAVASGFRDAGADVVMAARHAPIGERAWLTRDCVFVGCDVESPGALTGLIEDVDCVVHAIGRSLPAESNADPIADASTSLVSILRTLEAMRSRPGVPLLYVSSGGAIYGDATQLPVRESTECLPISSYGVMKLAAEKYLSMYGALHGVTSVSVRVANAYGPGQPVRSSQGFIAACIDAADRGMSVRLYGGGTNVRDFVYIGDVARAIVGLASCAPLPRVVNVASGAGSSLLDVVHLVERVTGKELQIEHVARRAVDVASVVLSTSLLETLIDWHPIDLEDGLGRTWEHLERTQARTVAWTDGGR